MLFVLYRNVNKAILCCLLFCTSILAYGQAGKLVTSSLSIETGSVVQLKWYSQAFVYPQGVTIYRQTKATGNWVKLNVSPIKRGAPIPVNLLNADSALNESYEIVRGLSDDQFKGIMLLNSIVQSFNNNHFANYLGLFYADTLLDNVDSVRYKVIHAKAGSEEDLLAISNWINPKLVIPFDPPKEIKIADKFKKVAISWLPETNRYYGVEVYRKEETQSSYVKVNDKPIMISETEATDSTSKIRDFHFEDEELKEKTTYSYYLKALNFFGEESESSEVFTVNVKDRTPPIAPVNLRLVDVKKNKVYLQWDNPSYDDAEKLILYRSKNYDGLYLKRNSLSLTESNAIDTANEGNGYYYYISALDAAANESKSNVIFVDVHDVTPPSIPVGVKAIADTGRVLLSWNKNLESDVKGYRVYRTVNKDAKNAYVLITPDLVQDTVFIDTLPKNAKNNFLYRIAAVDYSRLVGDKSAPVKVQLPDVTAPAQPFIKFIKDEGESLRISWVPNVEEDLSYYTLYRRSQSDTLWRVLSAELLPTQFSYLDKSVTNNTLYEYHLTATDSTGNISPASKLYPYKTKQIDNSFDEKLVLKVKYYAKKRLVKCAWNDVNEDDVGFVGYALFVKVKGASAYRKVSPVLLETKLKKGLELNEASRLQLRAYFKNGDVIKSNEITIKIE